MARPSGLGRGLSALLDDGKSAPSGGVRTIPVDAIEPHPDQPRRYFDAEALAELAQSIAERGVLQPILVRSHGGRFQIIAGERRWRAAQQAQLHDIPAIVRDSSDETTAELALIENIQREDLNALEEARAYKALSEKYEHSQSDIARIVGKSRSHVANLVRLVDLPADVQQLLMENRISMGHARALLAADDPSATAKIVVRDELSVRQVEALVRGDAPLPAAGTARAHGKGDRSVDPDIAALERQLSDILGLKVQVRNSGQGGQVTLAYRTLDQLDLICQRLSGETI